jgi:hypothetical protein
MSVGPLFPGHPMARKWTFTRKRWEAGSYLFLDGTRVLLSSVIATKEGQGYFRDLIVAIEATGRKVAIPCPLNRMQHILRHYGFEPHTEMHEIGEPVDVWERPVLRRETA